MNLLGTLQTLATNKHTTGAGLVFIVMRGLASLTTTWFPELQPKVETTMKTLSDLAVFYGLAAAGDAGKSVQGQQLKQDLEVLTEAVKTGDTSHLRKSDIPKP